MVEIRKYRDAQGRVPFDIWMNGLRDVRAKQRIHMRIRRLSLGLEGNWKSVGEGVRELRIPEGPGYRLYYAWDGKAAVILLCGGDKSSQRHDIDLAKHTGVVVMAERDKTEPYDPVDYLRTPEDIAEYINAAIADGNEQVMLAALKDVARAIMGISELAQRTGLSREALYNTLSESGNPRFSSLVEILHALGLELSVKPRGHAA